MKCEFPIKYFNMMYFWQYARNLHTGNLMFCPRTKLRALVVYEDNSLNEDKPRSRYAFGCSRYAFDCSKIRDL